MAIEIAQLRVTSEVDLKPVEQGLTTTREMINGFADETFRSAKLTIDISAAQAALKTLRGEYRQARQEFEQGMALHPFASARPVAQGIVDRYGTPYNPPAAQPATAPAIRPSTVNPAKIAATTAATIEQIEKTSESRSAARQRRRVDSVTDTAQKITNREAQLASKVEEIRVAGEARTATKLEQIRAGFYERQRLRAEAAASAPIAPLSQRMQDNGAGLMSRGRQTFYGGAIMTSMVTAPIVGSSAAIINFARDYQKAMNQVAGLTDIGADGVKRLYHQVLELTNDPNITLTPKELAQALYEVGSTGLKDADALEVLTASAHGATAGLGSTRVVADIATSYLNAYGKSAKEAAHAIDVVTSAVKFGKGEATAYAGAFARVIGIAAQSGVTFEEVAANLATMTRLGFKPSEAATGLLNLLNKLNAPTKGGKTALAGMALDAEAVRKSLKDNGLLETLRVIMERSHGSIDVLKELFGNVRGLNNILATAARQPEAYAAALEAAYTSAGETLEAARINAKGLDQQLDKLKAQSQAAAIEIGTKLLPPLTKFVSSEGPKAIATVKGLVDGFEAMPEPIQRATFGLVALVAMAGPLRMLLGVLQLIGGSMAIAGGAVAANPVVAAAAVAAAIVGYQAFNQALSQTAAEETRAAKAAGELDATMKRMQEVLPVDSKHYQALTKLREHLAAAGTDTKKLQGVIDELARAQHDIKVDTKIKGDLAVVLNAEIKAAEAQAPTIKVNVQPVWQQTLSNLGTQFGIYGPDSPFGDHFEPDITKTEFYENTGQLVDRVMGVFGPQLDNPQQYGQDWYDTNAALNRGTAHTRALKKAAAAQGYDPNYLTGPRPFNSLTAATRNPYLEMLTKPAENRVEAARTRLKKKKAATTKSKTKGTGDPLPHVAGGAADEAVEKRRNDADRLRQRALERSRAHQAEGFDAKAHQWSAFNNVVESLVGNISEFDLKTEAARVHAKLLKDEFSQIPGYMKTATERLAGMVDKLQQIKGTRDSLRDFNNETAAGLLRAGIDPTAFIKATRKAEKAFDFPGQVRDVIRPATAGGAGLATISANEAKAYRDKATALRDANALDGRVVNQAGTEITGAIIESIGKGVKTARGEQSCAKVSSAILEGIGVHVGSVPVAKQLRNKALAMGAVPMSVSAAQEGDLIVWRGQKYGKLKDADGAGYHTGVAAGGGKYFGSSRGKGAMHRITDPGHAVAYRFPQLTTAAGGAAGADPSTIGQSPEEIAQALLKNFDGTMVDSFGNAPWGKWVNDANMQQGEIRTAQLGLQDRYIAELQKRRLEKKSFSKKDLAGYREEMTGAKVADLAHMSKQQGANTWKQQRAFDRDLAVLSESERYIDNPAMYERQQHLTGKRFDIYDDPTIKDKQGALANEERLYDARKARESMLAYAASAREAARETEVLNLQRRYLGDNAGATERQMADGLDLVTKRQAEYNRLLDAQKTPDEAERLADEYAARERVNQAMRRGLEIEQQYASDRRGRQEDLAMLEYENKLIKNGVTNRAERARLVKAEALRRKTIKDLEPNTGTWHAPMAPGLEMISPEEAQRRANAAAGDVTGQDSLATSIQASDDNDDYNARHRAQMGLLAGQSGVTAKYGSDNPELQIQLQLLQRRNELEEFNRTALAEAQIDIEARLDDYEEEIRAEEELRRLTESRRASTEAQNELLDQQKEAELAGVFTAAERLAIEYKYQDILRKRAGIVVSDEEKATRGKIIEAVTTDENFRRAQDTAERIRDLLTNSLMEGSKNGVKGMLSEFAHGLAEMVRMAIMTDISTKIVGKLFGVQLEGSGANKSGGLFDMIGSVLFGKKKKGDKLPAPDPDMHMPATLSARDLPVLKNAAPAPQVIVVRSPAQDGGAGAGKGGPIHLHGDVIAERATVHSRSTTYNDRTRRSSAGTAPSSSQIGGMVAKQIISVGRKR